MPFSIVRDDIAHVSADAVVNAANPRLKAGGGVCGALFAAAGAADMQAACDAIGGCPTGSAVTTPAFALDAKWCIHAVGPVWNGGVSGEREALRSCYRALIDERGLADSEVYHRANLSRQLFSKIRSNRAYRPTKPTAVALAVALRLSVSQTQDLLARAGFTLSRSSKFDVIVRFFLERRIYDVFQINEALFAYDQPLLGSAG